MIYNQDIYDKEIDVRQTVQQFKKYLHEIFQIPLTRLRVFYVDDVGFNMGVCGPEELKYPQRLLHTYVLSKTNRCSRNLKNGKKSFDGAMKLIKVLPPNTNSKHFVRNLISFASNPKRFVQSFSSLYPGEDFVAPSKLFSPVLGFRTAPIFFSVSYCNSR